MDGCKHNRLRVPVTHAGTVIALLPLALLGCKKPIDGSALVGSYSVKGTLIENSCGQQALPAPNPYVFKVEIRENDGVGYWLPNKQVQNVGSLSEEGQFRFSRSQTQIYQGAGQMPPPLDQPSDFLDPERLQMPNSARGPACALTFRQTVSGALGRRHAADGGVVVELAPDAGGADDDLAGENVLDVAPSAGSDCNAALAAFGGAFLALPCSARYVLTGALADGGPSSTIQLPTSAGTNAAISGSGGATSTAGSAAP